MTTREFKMFFSKKEREILKKSKEYAKAKNLLSQKELIELGKRIVKYYDNQTTY